MNNRGFWKRRTRRKERQALKRIPDALLQLGTRRAASILRDNSGRHLLFNRAETLRVERNTQIEELKAQQLFLEAEDARQYYEEQEEERDYRDWCREQEDFLRELAMEEEYERRMDYSLNDDYYEMY